MTALTQKEWRQAFGGTNSKYRAKSVTTEDGFFSSKKEEARWCELKLLEKAGEIKDLKRQVRFPLHYRSGDNIICHYIADFTYFDLKKYKNICEDVKGYRKGLAYQLFKIKRKLFEVNYPEYTFIET